jgi:hypothetical protein
MTDSTGTLPKQNAARNVGARFLDSELGMEMGLKSRKDGQRCLGAASVGIGCEIKQPAEVFCNFLIFCRCFQLKTIRILIVRSLQRP